MKTSIEIADDLFKRVQQLARTEKTTVSVLVERGLKLVLEKKEDKPGRWKWKPLVVQGGKGLTEEFKNAPWEKFRDEIYRGYGA